MTGHDTLTQLSYHLIVSHDVRRYSWTTTGDVFPIEQGIMYELPIGSAPGTLINPCDYTDARSRQRRQEPDSLVDAEHGVVLVDRKGNLTYRHLTNKPTVIHHIPVDAESPQSPERTHVLFAPGSIDLIGREDLDNLDPPPGHHRFMDDGRTYLATRNTDSVVLQMGEFLSKKGPLKYHIQLFMREGIPYDL